MNILYAFLAGLMIGAGVAIFLYRRKSADIEGVIGLAVNTREDAQRAIDALKKKKFGG